MDAYISLDKIMQVKGLTAEDRDNSRVQLDLFDSGIGGVFRNLEIISQNLPIRGFLIISGFSRMSVIKNNYAFLKEIVNRKKSEVYRSKAPTSAELKTY